MKNFFVLMACLWQTSLFAQQPVINWSVSNNEADKRFIENKGQFNGRNRLPGSKILYGVDQGAVQIFFAKEGVSYYIEKKYKNPNRKKGDRTKPKLLKSYEVVQLFWEGANPNVTLTGEEKVQDYFTYSFVVNKDSTFTFDNMSGYKKLVYKNLYPHIDVEYVFHPETGVKYSVILHPGADASKVKMRYADGANLSINTAGNIIVPTLLGAIIEHAPVTFYARNNAEIISSQFVQEDNTISFQLGDYNRSKTVVIDPWVQTPALSNSNCVWECEKDALGNVYIIGGDAPMRLRKYNSAGVQQWTYVTPWDTTNGGDWLGTLATDLAGNSYVTNGSLAELHKVNTNGNMVWAAPAALFSTDEYWSVQFNCDQSRLIIGGTRLVPTGGVIFDINTTNGRVNNVGYVARTTGFNPNEVRALTSSYNAKYYYLTLDTIGCINQNFTLCNNDPIYAINSTYNFGYKSENYRPNNGNSGICAIRANDQFVYSQNGATIHKRSLQTGAILISAPIPGGISVNTPFLGTNQPGNNGIDIDDCGNVYVGSGDRVVKYDANLTLISAVSTPFRVYDVAVSYGGEIIVCGATGDNSVVNRTGYVQAINMSACVPYPLNCCDATICPAGPFCHTDAPVSLTRVTPGGTWSGPGITNTSTGTFSPAVAGPGIHTIVYILPCGRDSQTIVVNDCSMLEVCIEPNGQYTVSGGVGGPFTWETGASFQNCNNCPIPGFCIPILCPGFLDTAWTSFATGATVTTPGTFPIRVRDSGVNSLVINSAAGLPNCSTIVCMPITISVSAQTNVSCFGGNNGSATVDATGGTAPYTFRWQPGNFLGATRPNLPATTYSILATDANGCTGTGSVTITAPTALGLATSKTDATCAGSDGSASVTASGGTPNYTYLWSNGPTTASINNLTAGNYTVTVTDVNGCSATASYAIGSIGGPTVSLGGQTNILCNGDNNATIDITVNGGSPSYSYLWSNTHTTEDLSNIPGGNYSVTVTDANGCVSLLSTTIAEPAALSVTGVVADAGCGAPNGSIDQTVTGGVLPYVFQWSTASSAEDLAGLQAGIYDVTVTDNNSCSQTASYTINAPGSFTVSLTADSASCQGAADGSVTSTIVGGSAPFFYNWNTGDASANLTNVAPGTYTVTITDDNICTVSATASVSAPVIMTFTTSITEALCEGSNEGGIKLNVSGGTPPYSALWSNGGSGLTLTDLAPGVYSATVIDANGCNKDTTISLEAASTFSVEVSVVNAACDGAATGSATANIVDGTTPPYTYLWSNGETSSSITNITPGVYGVTVTDTLSCLRNVTATVGAGDGLVISSTVIDASCPDIADGSIATTISGGTEPYTYIWNTGAATSFLQNIPAGIYALTVTDPNDCSGTDTIVVHIDSSGIADCDTLVIYGVFSPNGDGTNDDWIIDGLESYPNNEIQIFNRWGSVVYEAQPYMNDWKGISDKDEALPSAAYYYVLKLNDTNKTVYSGSITLIR